jgi:ABC-type nitrate/sulfonate/bicarbonate transport system ATPase subunit
VSSIVVTHQLRDAFFIAEKMAVTDARGVTEIVPASREKLDQSHFLMLRDGVVAFDGTAEALRATTDDYLLLFQS